MIIVALSGGKSSAWCADWALKNFPKDQVTLYFNDTGWEHPDLHRFMDELSRYFNHPITVDSDGTTPEDLFYKHHALASNRMPFCSNELKAERLQKFYKDGDTIVFGISSDEAHRATRIISVYAGVSERTGKQVSLQFPLIANSVTSSQIDQFLADAGIEQPLLYRLGFQHNNCSGGCVRSGKGQWLHLLRTLPDVYADRERVENDIREYTGKPVSYLNGTSLTELRLRAERDEYFASAQLSLDFAGDCVGICSSVV